MWELAAEVAVHVYYQTPHKSINFKTPLEKFAPSVYNHFNRI